MFLLPAVFILNAVFGLDGLLWSSIAADILSTIINVLFAMRHRKRLKSIPAAEKSLEADTFIENVEADPIPISQEILDAAE